MPRHPQVYAPPRLDDAVPMHPPGTRDMLATDVGRPCPTPDVDLQGHCGLRRRGV